MTDQIQDPTQAQDSTSTTTSDGMDTSVDSGRDTGRVTFRDSQGGLHSVPYEHFGKARAIDPGLQWEPQSGESVAHVQTSDGRSLMIHGDDLPEAKKRDANLRVLRQPQPHQPDIPANRPSGATSANDDPMLTAFKERLQARSGQVGTSQSNNSGQSQESNNDAMVAAFKGRLQARQSGVDATAAKPGAYQQRPGGPIQNVNTDNQILHDENGNWTGQYLTKRGDETDSQFVARAIEAGKHVTPQMIQQEHQKNKRNAPLALGAAAAAGPAMLGAEALGAAPFVATSTPALAITGEATGEMIVGPSVARQALSKAVQLAAAHPKAAKAVGLGAVWVAAKVADELGVPLPKVLKLLVAGAPPVE